MNPQPVALIGATGLIGSHILDQLKNDTDIQSIRVLVRKPVEINHPKVEVIRLDFADPGAYRKAIAGCQAVFCAIGTTNAKVKGDKTAYRKVDYDIPVNAARFCAETGVQQFLLVSSVGANSQSNNFYLKLKGEVENEISRLSIPSIAIFRPSMLLGKRNESRPMESIAQAISKPLAFLFPSRYKPIAAADVARAMVAAGKQNHTGIRVYHYNEMITMV
ncbi:MAG TPA: NAD(P)H-binding protein [Bacteroidales bacterium]|nr:NAD(P)H-binding protein [Bacteroidales bacterium]HPI86321.1 NAD(P)H-binding protein [Bacteroidales bacterium]HPM93296.1 NAD(P)H-binding protein [Bacteroidales bacterium]